ncbi:MAG: OmpH family outer membrane protein [Saprospiraceae bacterium]
MKKLLGLSAIIAFLLLGTTTTTQAQQNIAHINTDTIVLRMTDYSKAVANVQAYGVQLQKLLKAKEDQLKAYAQQAQTRVEMGEMTPKMQQEAEQKIQQMRTELQAEALKADKSLADREQKMMTPVYSKFRAAMKAVAKTKGYSYIMDQKAFLYLDGGEDATQAVADFLKVDLAKPAAAIQQQQPANGGGGGGRR